MTALQPDPTTAEALFALAVKIDPERIRPTTLKPIMGGG